MKGKLILKLSRRSKRSRGVYKVLEKKRVGLILLSFRTCYKAVVIGTKRRSEKDRQVALCKR